MSEMRTLTVGELYQVEGGDCNPCYEAGAAFMRALYAWAEYANAHPELVAWGA